MKKLIPIVLLVITETVSAQYCDTLTPVFNVDLTGQPSGAWTSPQVLRQGNCCGTSHPDACLQFNLTLDSAAQMINFAVVSGAMPGGSLFYQIDCGPPTAVGTPICLNGPGPYVITFCKPGNNLNTYAITSIGEPDLQGTRIVSEACNGRMVVNGLIESSIQWTSIPPNALYNSYLSCTAGCDSVTVQPDSANLPAYIDYQVSGLIQGPCMTGTFTDSMRIYFVNDLAVTIQPDDIVLCNGASDTLITAIPTGGAPPYIYTWSTGQSTPSIRVQVGTYFVQIKDSRNCSVATDTVVVRQVNGNITADAGPDQFICSDQGAIQLNGIITVATGGVWSGGTGSYSPDSAKLQVNYLPSASEIQNGQVILTLTTTGNQGCPADSDQVSVAIYPTPAPQINGPSSVCLNEAATYQTPFNSGENYSWSVSGGQLVSISNNSAVILWTNTGSGSVQLTVTNQFGCDSTVTLAVNVFSLPTPQITGSVSVCTDGNFIYQTGANAGSVFNWTVTNGTISSGNGTSSIEVYFSGSGQSNMTVVETDTNGCIAMSSLAVSRVQRPQPMILGDSDLCVTAVETYTSPVMPNVTSVWSVTNGTVVSSSNGAITVQWNNPGTGTITLTQSSAVNCDSTVSLTVAVHDVPQLNITGPATLCQYHSGLYSIVPADTSLQFDWTISGGILNSTQSNTATVTFSNPGSGVVSSTVTNQFSCSTIVTMPVLIHRQPIGQLSGPIDVCRNSVNIYVAANPADVNTWTVTGGNVLSVSNELITVQWIDSVSGMIELHSSAGYCDTTVFYPVNILPAPTPVISGLSVVCSNRLTEFSVSGAITTDVINWTITGGTILNGNDSETLQVIFSEAGSEVVTVTVVGSNGCDVSQSFPVTILDGPVPVISGSNPVCKNDTGSYEVPFKQGHIYQWSAVGGAIISFSISNTVEVYWFQEGQGSVTCRQISPDGCDSTISMSVLVRPLPLPVISGPSQVCQFENALFTVVNNPGSDYTWSVDGDPVGQNGTAWQSTWNLPGVHNISIVEINSFGCSTGTSTVVRIGEKPVPEITGRPRSCLNEGIQRYIATPIPNTDFTWTISGGGVITSGANSDTVMIRWNRVGSFDITLHAINRISGCDSTITMRVTSDSIQRPVVAMNAFGCAPVAVMMNGNSTSPVYSYSWNFGDGNYSNNPNPLHVYTQSGRYTVRVNVQTNFGCRDSASSIVVVHPNPVAHFTIRDEVDHFMAGLDNIQLQNQSGGASVYQWDFGNGEVSDDFEPEITYNEPGIYTIKLIVMNSHGCRDTILHPLEVRVPEEIYIPNAFTPNGDDVNDFFTMTFLNIKEASVIIYNRWGEKIFVTNDLHFKWDGTVKGRMVQGEVYVYLVEAEGIYGRRFQRTGKVTVVN